MRLSDFKGLFRSQNVGLIRSEILQDDIHSFDFAVSDGTRWGGGEHGIFMIQRKGMRGRKWRAFSVATSCSENVVKIVTHIPDEPSSFKKALVDLNPGDNVSMRGPFGWFKFQDRRLPVVMLCGGVGVSPFRAMLREESGNRDICLIYASRGKHIFRDEFEEMAWKNKRLTIQFVSYREHLINEFNNSFSKYGKDAWYFVSGKAPLVKRLKANARKLGIPGKRIVSDAFYGY